MMNLETLLMRPEWTRTIKLPSHNRPRNKIVSWKMPKRSTDLSRAAETDDVSLWWVTPVTLRIATILIGVSTNVLQDNTKYIYSKMYNHINIKRQNHSAIKVVCISGRLQLKKKRLVWFTLSKFTDEYKDMELTGHLSSFYPQLSAVWLRQMGKVNQGSWVESTADSTLEPLSMNSHKCTVKVKFDHMWLLSCQTSLKANGA